MGFYRINVINDVEIEIKAIDLRDFLNTLIKSFSYIVLEGKIEQTMKKYIVLKSEFPDAAVDFFNELIYLFETENFIPHSLLDFKMEKDIFITVIGCKYNAQKNKIKRILKAATHHNLEFKRDKGFYLKMIVDI